MYRMMYIKSLRIEHDRSDIANQKPLFDSLVVKWDSQSNFQASEDIQIKLAIRPVTA